jgi:hypothetical protein
MNKLNTKENIALFSIFFLWLGAVIDPHGYVFYIRYAAIIISYLTILILLLNKWEIKIPNLHLTYLIFISGVMPFWGIVVGMLRCDFKVDQINDTSYIASGAIFLTSILFINIRNLQSVILLILIPLRILVVLILYAGIAKISGSSDMMNVAWFWVERQAALIGERNYYGFQVQYIYFFASPMLFNYLAYAVWNLIDKKNLRNVLEFSLVSISLLLTGTRANMLITLGSVLLVLAWRFRESKKIKILFFLALFISFSVCLINIELLLSLFSAEEVGNSTKISYLKGYANIYNDPITLLVGQGFEATNWSVDAREIISSGATRTELTYFEYVRVYGILITIIYSCLLFFVMYKSYSLKKEFKWIGPALMFNFLISALNPYMFSTNGMLLLSFGVALISRKLISSHQISSTRLIN